MMMMTHATSRTPIRAHAHRQHGVALFVSMILLLIMTVLAIGSMRGTMLEERMSSNMRQKQIAFEAAELALRRGEDTLLAQMNAGRPVTPKPSACNGPPCDFYAYTDGGLKLLEPSMWSGSYPHDGPQQDHLAERPQFVVEERQIIKDTLNVGTQADQSARYFYRVASRGVGEEAAAESIVQSTFVTRF